VECSAKPLRPSMSQKPELRALTLTEVPLDAFPEISLAEGRPRRRRLPPLESWRNECLVYERPRGSKAPEVAGVTLNLGPRAATDPPRQLGFTVLQAPLAQEEPLEREKEFVGLATPELETRIFTLPLGGSRPRTVKLPPARGQIYVIDGAVRCAYEGDPVAAELRLLAGDTALLREESRAVLVAPAELEGGEGHGSVARFFWIRLKVSEPAAAAKVIAKSSPKLLKAERSSPRPALQPLPPSAMQLEL